MNRLFIHKATFLLCLTLFGCNNKPSKQNAETRVSEDKEIVSDSEVIEVERLIEESKNYLRNRDFDGDEIPDHLSFDYTGGAHCCYKLNLKLSSMNDTIKYPFEMDGGYGFGIVDGSHHDQFDIDDYDKDGLPEIFMGISTYNGEKNPIDSEWTIKYGIKSNYIIFDFNDGKLVLEDYDKKKHITKPKLH